jgi:hypothetical protein
MSVRSVDMLTAALDQVVALVESAGIAATRDPGDFQPPGVIVAAPTITGAATMQSIGLLVPVYVVADEAGQGGLDWMLGVVTQLLPLFRESAAEPTNWISPLNPAGLPAYLITLRTNVATMEGAL